MKKKRTIISAIASIFVVVIIIAFIWIKFVPSSKIPFLKDNDNFITQAICSYPIKVSGDSMSPILQGGQTISSNKCFEKNELDSGVVILYRDNKDIRLGIIRDIQNLGRLVYKVSNERDLNKLQDVLPDDVVAIYEIDTSQTKYGTSNDTVVAEVDFEDYMTNAYLGTIPKGMGIETSTVQQSQQIDLSKDKFCFVLYPVKELRNVDIVIYEEQTTDTVFSIEDAILPIGENVNCDDGAIKLDQGKYEFKIFVNNILIKSIEFEITS